MGLPNIITKINSLETKHTALETKHNNFETKYNSEVVKLSGNQTIGGSKTFTSVPNIKGGSPGINLINTDVTKGTNPAATEAWVINCLDGVAVAAKNRLGLFQTSQNTAGNVTIGMWAYQPVADSTSTASVTVVYPASGSPYATAPTPAASSNTTQIATTAWVRGKGVLIESYISGTTWYRKYSDGWIEQGGQTPIIADYATGTITFYKAFANKNYTVTFSNWRNGTADDAYWNSAAVCNLKSKATTSFQIYNRGASDGGRYFSWYACGK
jgi:hypothetical protein